MNNQDELYIRFFNFIQQTDNIETKNQRIGIMINMNSQLCQSANLMVPMISILEVIIKVMFLVKYVNKQEINIKNVNAMLGKMSGAELNYSTLGEVSNFCNLFIVKENWFDQIANIVNNITLEDRSAITRHAKSMSRHWVNKMLNIN